MAAKYLIIPDVHNKVDLADEIIAREPADQVIFLGDFFDDWHDEAADFNHIATRVKEYLAKHICILGNHDQSYGFSQLCSGFTWQKSSVIHAVLDHEDFQKFRLYHWVDDWLLTHAGLDKHWLKELSPGQAIPILDEAQKQLSKPWPIISAGRDRGGYQPVGGVTWCDWSSLEIPAGANQLVGHTQAKTVRIKPDASGEYQVICIDTRLAHYAVLENGELFIKESKLK